MILILSILCRISFLKWTKWSTRGHMWLHVNLFGSWLCKILFQSHGANEIWLEHLLVEGRTSCHMDYKWNLFLYNWNIYKIEWYHKILSFPTTKRKKKRKPQLLPHMIPTMVDALKSNVHDTFNISKDDVDQPFHYHKSHKD